jgi:hypothetical protein
MTLRPIIRKFLIDLDHDRIQPQPLGTSNFEPTDCVTWQSVCHLPTFQNCHIIMSKIMMKHIRRAFSKQHGSKQPGPCFKDSEEKARGLQHMSCIPGGTASVEFSRSLCELRLLP